MKAIKKAKSKDLAFLLLYGKGYGVCDMPGELCALQKVLGAVVCDDGLADQILRQLNHSVLISVFGEDAERSQHAVLPPGGYFEAAPGAQTAETAAFPLRGQSRQDDDGAGMALQYHFGKCCSYA